MAESICNHCLGTGKTIDQKRFGKNLALARKAEGLRQDHVATAMGISKTYLCYLEHGRKHWTSALYNTWQASINKLNLKKPKQS